MIIDTDCEFCKKKLKGYEQTAVGFEFWTTSTNGYENGSPIIFNCCENCSEILARANIRDREADEDEVYKEVKARLHEILKRFIILDELGEKNDKNSN